MLPADNHLSDQQLILAADGELAGRRHTEVRAHLAACGQCRSRMHAVKGALADYVALQSATLDSKVPAPAGPRALLKARLAEIRSPSSSQRWHLAAQAAVALALMAASLVLVVHLLPHSGARAIPLRQLTPGAVRQVMKSDVCSAGGDQSFVIPVALQHRVFEEYGLHNAPPASFEVDYLITPELGGANDIRNLWPEPYSSTVWNAHVKDQLEDRLHQLVCDGRLDLSAAQRDISTDWIAAYKKYFHSDRPRQN